MNVYKTRLLNVVRALRESKKPHKFDMDKFGHFCGTPSCALGHYAARKDLQTEFGLTFWSGELKFHGRSTFKISVVTATVAKHFGITHREVDELFSFYGCNNAQTTEEAALYIEDFVARKWPTVTEPAAKKFIARLKETA